MVEPIVEATSATPFSPATPSPRRAIVALAVVSALLLVAVTLRLATAGPTESRDNDPGPYAGTELSEPWERPDFTLRDTNGQLFAFRSATEGRLTLLFFGYTSCPDICPLHLANLADVLDRPEMPRPIVVFVGVDPARDTPTRVRAFLDRFDEDFIGLVGTPEELAAAQEATGVAQAVVQEADESGGYLVGHASQIIAYTADDLAHVVYPFGVRQQDWVQDLPLLAAREAVAP